jgi:AraC-like DNA-binding protein
LCGSFRGQQSLEARAESQPDETAWQSGKCKQQTKAYRLGECCACGRVQVAEGLMEADPSCKHIPFPRHLDVAALKRARQYLDTQKTRVVHSWELEAMTGLTRYDLARQFRVMYGTSPYRYLLMRRLTFARQQLAQGRSLVEVALEAGFADQAHFSRMFKATFGITPARYRALSVPERSKEASTEKRNGVNAAGNKSQQARARHAP